jgi:hypothetical protein
MGASSGLVGAKGDAGGKNPLRGPLAGETKRLEVHLTIEDNGDSPRGTGQTA